MRTMLDKIKSRKFLMALLAAVTAFIKAYYPDFPDEALYTLAGVALGYIAVEGFVDAVAQLAQWLAKRSERNAH
ncbi:hypothetical protein [Carboxydothermus hydrogenoformans]|nr:hypothetical protein [Carboxydothermus hydrogenoformans]